MKESFFRARMCSKFIIFPILSELYSPGLQAACVNISITSGTQTITDPSIDNSGCSDASGIGYSAATGGILIINNNSPDNVNYTNTGGTGTYAAQAMDGGSITINGGGIFSLISGYGDIVFYSTGNGATLTATNSTLTIAGDYAIGLQADSGGTIIGNNLTVNVSSSSATDFSKGAYASGASSTIELIGGSVQMDVQSTGYGLYADSNGTITTTNVAINVATATTSGALFGAYADGATIHLLDGSSVQVSGGDRSHGLDALNLGEVLANNLIVKATSSNVAFGIYTYDGTINLQGGSIQANGTNYADGLNAQGGGTITANNVTVTANGSTSYGATVSETDSMLSLTNSSITVLGEFASGLAADIGGTLVGNNITVNSTGLGAAVTNGSSLSLTGSTITANGGSALVTTGGQVGNANTIIVHGGSLNSPTADLIKANTAVSNITLNTVTTGASGSNNLLSINNSTINFIAEQNSNLGCAPVYGESFKEMQLPLFLQRQDLSPLLLILVAIGLKLLAGLLLT